MPTRPLSHAARQRQARGHVHEDALSYAQQRVLHGPDPRSTKRWQRLRLLVLNAGPLCADPYTQHTLMPALATEVDHIRGVWEAPDLVFDERNLQPLCKACHAKKSARERGGLHDVWLICGPPGAGKSTYVKQHMLPGDMVLDWDRLMIALSGRDWHAERDWNDTTEHFLRYVGAAYDAVIATMERHKQTLRRTTEGWIQPLTWVLGTLAARQRRRILANRIGARCLVLAAPAELCYAHIASDPVRKHDVARWVPLVQDWWARYEPDDADEVVEG